MKIINAGFGRTGTTSLKAALEQLGFAPVHHSTDLILHPEHVGIWERAAAGEVVDWRAFYRGYEVADHPAGLFYEDIIRAHPEAKVLLSVRDPEGWYESMAGMLRQVRSLNLPLPHVRRFKAFIEKRVIGEMFGGNLEDKAHAINVFEYHNEAVRAFVPAERLLVYRVQAGWEPLCAFLEVEVPQTPFPRLNERGGLKEMAMSLFNRSGASATPSGRS